MSSIRNVLMKEQLVIVLFVCTISTIRVRKADAVQTDSDVIDPQGLEVVPYSAYESIEQSEEEVGGLRDWPFVNCDRCSCPAFAGSIGITTSNRTCQSANLNLADGAVLAKQCAGSRTRGIVCADKCFGKPSTENVTLAQYADAACAKRKSERPELSGTGRRKQCQIRCQVKLESGKRNGKYIFLRDYFPDGTLCGTGKFCVAGHCLNLACDGNAVVADASSDCPNKAEICDPLVRQAKLKRRSFNIQK